jgi:hypothetical protein
MLCSRIVLTALAAANAQASDAARPETLPRLRQGDGRSQGMVRPQCFCGREPKPDALTGAHGAGTGAKNGAFKQL